MTSMRETINLLALREGESTDLGAADVEKAVEMVADALALLASTKVDDALYGIDANHDTRTQSTKEEILVELKAVSEHINQLYQTICRVKGV